MNWSRKEWSAVFIMSLGLLIIWLLYGTTAMFRLGALWITFGAVRNIVKGVVTYKNPKERTRQEIVDVIVHTGTEHKADETEMVYEEVVYWTKEQDKDWAKFAIISGIVLIVVALILAFYVPAVF